VPGYEPDADNGVVQRASIGAGGVAATPVRATQTEAALRGQPWTPATCSRRAALRAEFQPISDMRASGAYRSEVLGNLLQRFWLESQGLQQINLESFTSGRRTRHERRPCQASAIAPPPHARPASGVSRAHESARAQVAGAARTWTTSPRSRARCTLRPS
jgi:hypothetical protein